MEVRIRLKRIGKKKQPIFRIVAQPRALSSKSRELEKIGMYFPEKEKWEEKVVLDFEKFDKWIKKGATMSESVSKLVKKARK